MKIDGKRPASRLCNVTVEADVRDLIQSALDQLGRIDVLINNAGLGGTVNVVDMTDEQWHTVLDVTLTGTFRMTRAVLPHMLERRAGVIVNNASVLGWRAQAGQAHYAAAKAGVMALTRCSAPEANGAFCFASVGKTRPMLHSELFGLVPHLHAMYQGRSAADSRSHVNRLGHLFDIGTFFETGLGERIDAIRALDCV